MEATNDFERVDPFRGTTQRWHVESGMLAGTVVDCAFNDDWTLVWRIVAGPRQGQAGRTRRFAMQRLRPRLFLVSFALLEDARLTAAVDMQSRRLTGFAVRGSGCEAFSGALHVL